MNTFLKLKTALINVPISTIITPNEDQLRLISELGKHEGVNIPLETSDYALLVKKNAIIVSDSKGVNNYAFGFDGVRKIHRRNDFCNYWRNK